MSKDERTAALPRTTTILTVTYFAHIMTFYFILTGIPKMIVDMGYQASSAGGVLVRANVGGLCGALALALFSRKVVAQAFSTSVRG